MDYYVDWKLTKKWFPKNLYSMVLMAGIDSDRLIGDREYHIWGSLLK